MNIHLPSFLAFHLYFWQCKVYSYACLYHWSVIVLWHVITAYINSQNYSSRSTWIAQTYVHVLCSLLVICTCIVYDLCLLLSYTCTIQLSSVLFAHLCLQRDVSPVIVAHLCYRKTLCFAGSVLCLKTEMLWSCDYSEAIQNESKETKKIRLRKEK